MEKKLIALSSVFILIDKRPGLYKLYLFLVEHKNLLLKGSKSELKFNSVSFSVIFTRSFVLESLKGKIHAIVTKRNEARSVLGIFRQNRVVRIMEYI